LAVLRRERRLKLAVATTSKEKDTMQGCGPGRANKGSSGVCHGVDGKNERRT
jgi:hypothetical protein